MSADAGPRPALADLVRDGDLDRLHDWLQGTAALEIAAELERLAPDDRAAPFRLLAKDRASAVFDALDRHHQQELITSLRDDHALELFRGLRADDRARLLDEMPARVAAKLQNGLTPQQREVTDQLLGYPPESAGRMMHPVGIKLIASMTVGEALEKIRQVDVDEHWINVIAVTDEARHLIGTVTLPHLVTASAETRISDLLVAERYEVVVDTDREVAARLIQEADLLALPVVDHEDRLVGMVHVDDAMEVLELEATEDQSRAAGAQPLEVPYMAARVLDLARKRAMWLLILVFAAILTVNVLGYFEDTLDQVVVLALFIPLLIDTGGNAGTQASTVVIRALALDEVRPTDLRRIIFREARVGALLGALLGVVALPVASPFFGFEIALVIGLTLFAICTWASFVGSLLPLVAKRHNVDPAVFSAPLVTTLVDATGLIIYFTVAKMVLPEI